MSTHENRCPTCVIAGGQVETARRREAEARLWGGVSRDAAVVALRWLKRAGRLRPQTDDERALLRMFEMELALDPPNRRICHPAGTREEYVDDTARIVAGVLGGGGA